MLIYKVKKILGMKAVSKQFLLDSQAKPLKIPFNILISDPTFIFYNIINTFLETKPTNIGYNFEKKCLKNNSN
jgi:hypothetical protein